MKNLKFALVIASVLCLSACGSTIEGLKRDGQDISQWTQDQPSRMGQHLGRIPKGYGEIDREMMAGGPILKPGMTAPFLTTGASFTQGMTDDFSTPVFVDGASRVPSGGVAYNSSVTVFPLDDDGISHNASAYDYQPRPITSEGDMPYSIVSGTGVRIAGQTDMAGFSQMPGALMQKIFFRHGSAALDAHDSSKIADVARQAGGRRIMVEGHASKRVNGVADETQRWTINHKMSAKRADAVSRALQAKGISASWIATESFGDSRPNMEPDGKSQEAADRRVEIYAE